MSEKHQNTIKEGIPARPQVLQQQQFYNNLNLLAGV